MVQVLKEAQKHYRAYWIKKSTGDPQAAKAVKAVWLSDYPAIFTIFDDCWFFLDFFRILAVLSFPIGPDRPNF